MTIEEQIRQRRMEIQNSVSDNILKGFESDIEKARSGTYADNAENRRLMRVGQKYGDSSNTFKPGKQVRVTLPTGKIIDAVYVEPYGRDRHSVKDEDGRLYGVTTDNIEKITTQSKKGVNRIGNLKEQINTLNRERKRLELDMEDELGQLSEEERNDGNNKLVVYYGRELSKVDNKLQKLNSELIKLTKAQETEASVTDLIKAGVLEYDDSIEKAVYADTPQNRKLGRVGQEYHRGKGKKVEEKSAKKGVKTEEKKSTDKKQKVEKNPVKAAAKEFDEIVEPTNNWGDDDWNDMKKNNKLVKDLKSVVDKYNLSEKEFKEAFGHHAYGLDISYRDLKSDEGDVIKTASKEFDKIVNETDEWSDDDWFDDKKQNKLISDLKAVVKKYKLSEKDFKTAWGHHAYGLDISYNDLK